jgi:chemotaxis protein methyltransferase CheR
MTLAPDVFQWVADMVAQRSAIQLAHGKEYLVESRLAPLAKERGFAGIDAYVRHLRGRSSEADAALIVDAMTTNETSWFRDGGPFDLLRTHVLPGIVAARGANARVRVWSAACSTGQEPYSIAMIAKDVLPSSATIEILGTDIAESVLVRAREAGYSQLEVRRGLPAALVSRFGTTSQGQWQVAPAVRAMVKFAKHNLLDAPPAGPFDIVFLRNVLIYFDDATKRSVLARVRRTLGPGGVLVLGAAETAVGIDDSWVRAPYGNVWLAGAAGTGPASTLATLAASSTLALTGSQAFAVHHPPVTPAGSPLALVLQATALSHAPSTTPARPVSSVGPPSPAALVGPAQPTAPGHAADGGVRRATPQTSAWPQTQRNIVPAAAGGPRGAQPRDRAANAGQPRAIVPRATPPLPARPAFPNFASRAAAAAAVRPGGVAGGQTISHQAPSGATQVRVPGTMGPTTVTASYRGGSSQ